jgi:hypothetical protein
MLTDEQLLRYSRQIMLTDVDIERQERGLDAKVLINQDYAAMIDRVTLGCWSNSNAD